MTDGVGNEGQRRPQPMLNLLSAPRLPVVDLGEAPETCPVGQLQEPYHNDLTH